jgi:hypothetical protein
MSNVKQTGCFPDRMSHDCENFGTSCGRQTRFGRVLDHGHEAAVCRNKNKTLTSLRHANFFAKHFTKRCHNQMFGAWAVFNMPQHLSENATAVDSIAVALFVTKLQALGSKVTSEARAASMMSACCVFDVVRGSDLHHRFDVRQVVVGMMMELLEKRFCPLGCLAASALADCSTPPCVLLCMLEMSMCPASKLCIK